MLFIMKYEIKRNLEEGDFYFFLRVFNKLVLTTGPKKKTPSERGLE